MTFYHGLLYHAYLNRSQDMLPVISGLLPLFMKCIYINNEKTWHGCPAHSNKVSKSGANFFLASLCLPLQNLLSGVGHRHMDKTNMSSMFDGLHLEMTL